MNTAQKAILALGGVVLLANLVFPPWECQEHRFAGATTLVTITDMGRHFLGDSPTTDKPEAPPRLTYVICIKWSILAATSLALVVGTGLLFGLTVLFKDAIAKALRFIKSGEWYRNPN